MPAAGPSILGRIAHSSLSGRPRPRRRLGAGLYPTAPAGGSRIGPGKPRLPPPAEGGITPPIRPAGPGTMDGTRVPCPVASPDRGIRPCPPTTPPRSGPGPRAVAAVLLLYLAALAAATWPVAREFGRKLPASRVDPLQHLTLLRWYRTSLLEGRPVGRLPGLQAPVGASLAQFSPLHLQALLYLPVSAATDDDVLAYNLLWAAGFLLTGMGTFALAWRAVGSLPAAAFAGLSTMLSAPMLLHGMAHLELIYVGTFPLFLAAWIAFVDRPTPARLAWAAGAFLLTSAGAAYFSVFSVLPSALYVAWSAPRHDKARLLRWLRDRTGWLLAFALLAGVGAGLLFAATGGGGGGAVAGPASGGVRPRRGPALELPGADAVPALVRRRPALPDRPGIQPGGGRLVPRLRHPVPRLPGGGPPGPLRAIGVLVGGAGAPDPPLVRRRLEARHGRGPAAGGWLRGHFFGFRLIRVPARFNLFAAVLAAVVAATGLADLLGQLRRRWVRGAVVAGLMAAVVIDAPGRGYAPVAVPEVPSAYARLRARDPGGTVLDRRSSMPTRPSGCRLCGYWQSRHGLATTAGSSGHPNPEFDARLVAPSPFHALRLVDPGFLADPDSAAFGPVVAAPAADYLWLYLVANRLDHVVLHRGPDAFAELPLRLDRLEALLRPALIERARTSPSTTAIGSPPLAPGPAADRRLAGRRRRLGLAGEGGGPARGLQPGCRPRPLLPVRRRGGRTESYARPPAWPGRAGQVGGRPRPADGLRGRPRPPAGRAGRADGRCGARPGRGGRLSAGDRGGSGRNRPPLRAIPPLAPPIPGGWPRPGGSAGGAAAYKEETPAAGFWRGLARGPGTDRTFRP